MDTDNEPMDLQWEQDLKRLFEDKVKKPIRQILFGELKHGGTVKATAKKITWSLYMKDENHEEAYPRAQRNVIGL